MKITVVGLGRLGTVAAAGLAAAGHEVMGLDVDERRVRTLRDGRIPFFEPGLQEYLASAGDRGNLRFLQVEGFAGRMGDIVLITVGTPAAVGGKPDLRQVRAALAWIRGQQPRGLVLVMKSTVPPGSGEDFIHNDLEGLDVDYVASPEFLREGRALKDWFHPDRIVLGAGPRSEKALSTVRGMYSGIESPFLVTDITSAEMIKYASNAFLATRISFINEMASLCDAVGASIDAVSDGLALDGRTGARIQSGVGYGGSCLPKDIHALKHLAESAGLDPVLLEAVASVNNRQRRLPLETLNTRFQGCLEGLQIGVLGLAFKPGTDDVREAPSLNLIRELVAGGTKVRAYDPQATASARELLPPDVAFAETAEETAVGAHALILLTEWRDIVRADWPAMASQMLLPRFLFDGRNALDARRMGYLGFEYAGVGRGDTSQPVLLHNRDDSEVRAPGLDSMVRNSVRHPSRGQSEVRYA